jgi:RNA polymerase sigma factor (sigma-70 family)
MQVVPTARPVSGDRMEVSLLPSPTADQVVEQFASDAFRLARLMCRTHDEATDVASEAMVRLIEVWDRSRPEFPKAYLHRIILNIVIDRHRKATRFRRVAHHLVGDEMVDDSTNLLDNRSALADALDQLKPDARAVVVLRYWFDLSVREVAELMSIPTGSVTSLVSRSLPVLRTYLESGEDHE